MKGAILIFVNLLQLYFVIGILVALLVQYNGLKKIDPSVDGAGVGFRLITFFGIVALWPVILIKWFKVFRNAS